MTLRPSLAQPHVQHHRLQVAASWGYNRAMILFECILGDGVDGNSLLSEEAKQSSGAQIMTPEEAAFVGLEGIPEDPQNRHRVLIACAPSAERFVQTRLEQHAGVQGFRAIKLG